MPFDSPYFDDILGRSPDSRVARVFKRHVHWGYFTSSEADDGSDEAYLVAAEAMTQRVCLAGRVRDDSRILDCGCGFGGTIAHLNERLSGCELVGLNIDERQVLRAREQVQAGRGNTVQFVTGDACALPFGDASFDVVLAVECIFHFPSRQKFFADARRVLKTGGTLMVSDFVINDERFEEMTAWLGHNGTVQGGFFGSTTSAVTTSAYRDLARAAGFTMIADTDITEATMPTYPWLRQLYREAKLPEGVKTSNFLEEMARRGFFEYRVMSLEPAERGVVK
jgi:ubiquinone/menaquinone biosynthesis C-methylase UbiE